MKIFCSTEFSKNLKLLSKQKFSNTYGGLKEEIATFFKEHDTFEKVWGKSYMIRETKFVRINKIRLGNPSQHSGTSGGFRMIVVCDNRTQDVGIICVYPKTGPHGRADTPDDLLRKWVKAYIQNKKDNLLKECDV